MTVFSGPDPDSSEDLCTTDPKVLAYLTPYSDDQDRKVDKVDVIICPKSMLIPLLKEMDCSRVSDHVDQTFLNLGSLLVHEYTHWIALMQPALDLKDPPIEVIGEYKGPDPVDGYGPYNVLLLRGTDDPTQNADSFMWFATEA